MTRVTDDVRVFDTIMIERLQDGCHDFCDDIRVIMRDLVEDERVHKWEALISVAEDLSAALRILTSYGVHDWFPDIAPEMQKPSIIIPVKKKVKPRKKVKSTAMKKVKSKAKSKK